MSHCLIWWRRFALRAGIRPSECTTRGGLWRITIRMVGATLPRLMKLAPPFGPWAGLGFRFIYGSIKITRAIRLFFANAATL